MATEQLDLFSEAPIPAPSNPGGVDPQIHYSATEANAMSASVPSAPAYEQPDTPKQPSSSTPSSFSPTRSESSAVATSPADPGYDDDNSDCPLF